MTAAGDDATPPVAGAAGGAATLVTAARARWAVTAVFLINGLLLSSYLVRIPSLKVEHQLSEGQLGVVLTLLAVAALVTMQFVGGLVARFGSARLIRPALVALPLAVVGVGLAGNPFALALAVVGYGIGHGMVDVAMNAHAVAVERVRGRPILNGCHAAWSISAVIGSLVGGGVTRVDVSPAQHFLGLAVVLLPVGLVAGVWLLPATVDRGERPAGDDRPPRVGWRAGWTRPVLLFGAMGATVMVCEGVVAGWSGVFLYQERGSSLAAATLGYAGFTAALTLGRLGGDRLHQRYGGPPLFRAGAGIAFAGMAVVVLSPSAPVAMAGFAVLGLGSSVLVPLIVSAVGHAGGTGAGAATLLSRFTTLTYSGVLLGPMLVGLIAEVVGLTWTLAGLLPLLAAVMLNSRLLPRSAPTT